MKTRTTANPVTSAVPGIQPAEFQARRARLMAELTSNDVAIVPGASIRYRNRDTEYPFRQDSDFYYLTGFDEPDSVLVLAPGSEPASTVLFCPERDPAREQWTGERLGPERAPQALGVDAAFPNSRLEEILPRILNGRWCVHTVMGEHPEFDQRLIACASTARARGANAGGCEFQPLQRLLHEHRLIKSPAEQQLIAAAGSITADAHTEAMRHCRPGLSETQLEAVLVHAFMQAGARAPAYPSIVAGGRNACVMHYVRNDSLLADGDVVLIDAGCELEHYASDVTRTFPVNGTYSPRQRDLYEVVLAAQAEAIAAATPGAGCTAPQDAST
ncbi:MAG: aminopeptidase P N-terminal domain-containing protein, partial [Gammaproteobacteria bacterium]|nr:aminopeptidase P N-terminal domain-containing protein [Gammaproteobacteria bacterium]